MVMLPYLKIISGCCAEIKARALGGPLGNDWVGGDQYPMTDEKLWQLFLVAPQ